MQPVTTAKPSLLTGHSTGLQTAVYIPLEKGSLFMEEFADDAYPATHTHAGCPTELNGHATGLHS